MATIKIRYFTQRPKGDRNGGGFRNFWQPSKKLIEAGWRIQRLPDDETEAMREAQRLNTQLDEWYAGKRAAPSNHPSGTIDWLISFYKESDDFKDLKTKTKRTYNHSLKVISEWAGDTQVRAITPGMVQTLYKSLGVGRATANNVIRMLRTLLEFARKNDIIPSNPALSPGIKDRSKKGALWEFEYVAALVKAADEEGLHSVGTAILINEWLGQRKSDILFMRQEFYNNGELTIDQAKVEDAVVVLNVALVPHIHARLEEELARTQKIAPNSPYIIVNQTGYRWNEGLFTAAVKQLREKVAVQFPKMQACTFMTLRHTAITRMFEAGLETPLIAAISGHSLESCDAIIDRYGIRTKRMAERALEQRYQYELQNEKSNVRHFSKSNESQNAEGK